MSLWNQLSVERRRHVGWGVAGVAISWGLAALMAYIGPTSDLSGDRARQLPDARADAMLKRGLGRP